MDQPTTAPAESRGLLQRAPWMLAGYLIAVTAVVVVAPEPYRGWLTAGLLALQFLILLAVRCPILPAIASVWRLRTLFGFLAAAYVLLPGRETDSVYRPFDNWFGINLTGAVLAIQLILQFSLMVVASYVVRNVASPETFVRGLLQLRVSPMLAYALDGTLALLSEGGGRGGGGGGGGRGRGGGGGGGGGGWRRRLETEQQQAEGAPQPKLRDVLLGNVQPLVHGVRRAMDRGRERAEASGIDPKRAADLGVLIGVGTVMMTFKMVKTLPGIPFASGHKGVVFIPLYILAAELTSMRFGATVAGSVMGVVGFFNGDGRYGVFEVFKHLAAGLCVDLLWPFVRRWRRNVFALTLLGLAAAVGRTATELMMTLWAGARAEIYAFPAFRLAPNLVAGFLSGIVSRALLVAFEPVPESDPGETPPRSVMADVDPEIPVEASTTARVTT